DGERLGELALSDEAVPEEVEREVHGPRSLAELGAVEQRRRLDDERARLALTRLGHEPERAKPRLDAIGDALDHDLARSFGACFGGLARARPSLERRRLRPYAEGVGREEDQPIGEGEGEVGTTVAREILGLHTEERRRVRESRHGGRSPALELRHE